MRKAYVQPEAELLSLASLQSFLAATADEDFNGDDNGFENGPDNDDWA
ncbi:MAG: hypothetical protein J6Q74_01605 [Clostridia bacterium]|nr:hypothetical protein [Clostridia bacterium]